MMMAERGINSLVVTRRSGAGGSGKQRHPDNKTVPPGATAVYGPGPPPPTLATSLALLQDMAERALMRLTWHRVEALLGPGFRSTPWTPTAPLEPPGPSDHVPPLLALLQVCGPACCHVQLLGVMQWNQGHAPPSKVHATAVVGHRM
jgi:hypothetical protein